MYDFLIVSEDAEIASADETASQGLVRFKKAARHYFTDLFQKAEKKPRLVCADFCVRDTITVVTGFSNGSFFIHMLPEFDLLTSLK